MDTDQISREPAGQKTGGQFAPQMHIESDIELTGVPQVPEELAQLATGSRQKDWLAAMLGDGLNPSKYVGRSKWAASTFRAIDDFVQKLKIQGYQPTQRVVGKDRRPSWFLDPSTVDPTWGQAYRLAIGAEFRSWRADSAEHVALLKERSLTGSDSWSSAHGPRDDEADRLCQHLAPDRIVETERVARALASVSVPVDMCYAADLARESSDLTVEVIGTLANGWAGTVDDLVATARMAAEH